MSSMDVINTELLHYAHLNSGQIDGLVTDNGYKYIHSEVHKVGRGCDDERSGVF